MANDQLPSRQIRAVHNAKTLVVYQAFSVEIAEPALAAGRFVPPFKLDRMTWIKPSFLWMMYRCGWATKPGQERVLAVTISRNGFEWALAHSNLSHYDPSVYASEADWAARKNTTPVRVQWDPDRSLMLEPLGHRAIQVGLGGPAVPSLSSVWMSTSDASTSKTTGSSPPVTDDRAQTDRRVSGSAAFSASRVTGVISWKVRHTVESDATAPNRLGWVRRCSMSAQLSPPPASTAIC